MIPIDEIKNHYGIEIALVVLCCRVHSKTEEGAALQIFCDGTHPDWRRFLHLVSYHRIEPIIFKILGTIKNIPSDIVSQIKQKQLLLVQQNFKQALETERIIQLLKENGIDCIPYKGVAFSKQFYGDIVSRESSDIDVVVAPAGFTKVIRLMQQEGFSFENRVEYNYFKTEIFRRKKGLSFNKYIGTRRESHIEFHWRITENHLRVKTEAHSLLFDIGQPIEIAKESVRVINPDSHFVAVLIHHALSDAFHVLRSLIDISRIAFSDSNTADLDKVKDTLKKNQLTKAASMACFLVEALIGVQLPIEAANAPRFTSRTKNYFVNQLLEIEKYGDFFKPSFYNSSVLFLKDSLASRLSYLLACFQLRFVPATKDIRIFNLPKRLRFLYAVLKPIRSLISPVSDEEEKKLAMDEDKNHINF